MQFVRGASTLRVAAIISVIAFSAAAANAAVIVNGGFEDPVTPPASGTFTSYAPGQVIGTGGWLVVTLDGPPDDVMVIDTNYTEGAAGGGTITFNAFEGTKAADLTGLANTGVNGITQTIATVIDQAYALSFYVGRVSGNAAPPDTRYNAPAAIDLLITDENGILVDETFVNSGITFNSVNWKKFTVNFVATATSTVITFFNATPSPTNYAGLDNVSIAEVPEPGSLALMGLGALGMGFIARRRKLSAA